MNPFVPKDMFSQIKKTAGFDDMKADNLKNVVQQTEAETREQQSIIESARAAAFDIVATLLQIISDGQLEDGELPSDALDNLLLEATDGIDDEDGTYFDLLTGAVSDVLNTLGIDETTVNEIFGDDVAAADAAIEAAVSTAIANMPDDGDELDSMVREFIFGMPNEVESDFDAMTAKVGALSAKKVNGKRIAYRGTVAIRHGKKVVVNKRLANQTVRQTSAQKQATKKARLKAMSANNIRKRIKSLMKGKKMGLYK